MSPLLALIIGVLVGWIVEWIIDWVYWRKINSGLKMENAQLKARLAGFESDKAEVTRNRTAWNAEKASLEAKLGTAQSDQKALSMQLQACQQENGDMKNRFAALEGQQSSATASRSVEVVGAGQDASPAEVAEPVATQPTVLVPDDLTVIKGIGPVIASKLNQAGIFTFEQLGGIDAARLREIVGDVIQRLADEDHLLQQARDLAAQKRTGG